MTAVLSTSLKGAVALTTGGAGQIGRAICAALSAAGARVIATDLSASVPSGLNVDDWMQHDVTSAQDWARVLGCVRSRFARLDCLINSAGICPVNPIAETSLEELRRTMSVNVESILLSLRAALPLLRESGKDRSGGSSVVNLSSAAGMRGVPFFAAYCASKGAVTLLSKAAAKEFAALKYPVRVNSVHPSGVDSPMMDQNLKRLVELGVTPSLEEARALTASRSPRGRMAHAEEIAGVVAFLCSPAAGFIGGAQLVVDGGMIA